VDESGFQNLDKMAGFRTAHWINGTSVTEMESLCRLNL
jgi:hypothetical protein